MTAGPLAPAPTAAASHEAKEALESFGDLVPFADPGWYQGVSASCLIFQIGTGSLIRGAAVPLAVL